MAKIHKMIVAANKMASILFIEKGAPELVTLKTQVRET